MKDTNTVCVPAPPRAAAGPPSNGGTRGHWGIGIRRRRGRLEIRVPDSEEPPVRVAPAGRAVSIAPGETRTLKLPEY
ncbi:hypothetical protein ACWC4E_10840 [Streptomyces sp. NPDC001273]|uniref:hypothetical protein n=1 Tax=unclassified Streptomyces TaxID=2593676 RepID=UPI0033EC9AB2